MTRYTTHLEAPASVMPEWEFNEILRMAKKTPNYAGRNGRTIYFSMETPNGAILLATHLHNQLQKRGYLTQDAA